MKQILLLLLMSMQFALTAMASPWDGTIATTFAGGTGISNNPYQIATAEQLAYLASLANASAQTSNANTAGKYYKLTADIDLNGPIKSWIPIGIATSTAFAGIFDGDNHTISNININDATTVYAGLFGYPTGTNTANVIVKNLTITSGSITVTNAGACAGAFAGRALYTQFLNCKNKINVTAPNSVGGIVGVLGSATTTCLLENCSNTAAIKATNATAGGIVGNSSVNNTSNTYSHIYFCFNTGAITALNNSGGIVGAANSGNLTIDQCYNKGVITANNNIAGGIVGYGYGLLNISNCYNNAIVRQTAAVNNSTYGGILGRTHSTPANYFTAITNCYNVGNVTITNGTSGCVKEAIVGLSAGRAAVSGKGLVVNCHYLNTLTVTEAMGGNSQLSADLMAGSFVSTINNSQSPAVWISDINGMNAGYPILKWQAAPKLKPSCQVSTVSKGSITTSSILLNWIPALPGETAADGCLLKASDGVITDPVDGVDPLDLPSFVGGVANIKLYTSATTAPSFGSMSAGTMYNYKIYSFTNSGIDILFNTTSVPTVNVATMPNAVKAATLVSTSATTANISWTAANNYNSANHSTLVFVKAATSIISGTPSLSPTNYIANTAIGSGTAFQNDASAYSVYNGDGTSVSITGLNPGTKYYMLVYTVVDAANFDLTNSYSDAAIEAIYWTGAAGADTNWTNPLNWSSNTVPSSKDQVCIFGGYTVTVSTNVGSIDKLTLGTTTDAIQPKLLITSTGSLTVSSTSVNQTELSLLGAAIDNAGSLNIITGSGSSDGILFADSYGSTVASSSYSGTGSLFVNTESDGNQAACIHFQQKDANPIFNTSGVVSLCAASGMYAINTTDGDVNLGGSGTINAGTNVPYGLMKINASIAATSVTVSAGLTINSFSRSLSTSSGAVYLGAVFGNKLINNGTINIGGSSANGVYSEPQTTFVNEITNAGTLNLSGSLSKSSIYISGSGSTLITNSGTLNSTGNNTAEGITVKSNLSTTVINNSGTMNFGENGSNTRSITLGDGKSIFNNSGTITIGKGYISGTVGTGKAKFNNTGGMVNFNSPWSTKTTKVNDIQLVGTTSFGFFAEKVRKKLPVSICYIGGSITVGSGASTPTNSYYSKSSGAIKAEIVKRGGTATSYNAGIGGTPSGYGAYRVGAQVLIHNPDLLIVEFAVNDGGTAPMDRIDGIEGIVRQAIRQNPQMAILFLYTSASTYQTNYFSKGNVMPSIDSFHKVAQQYQIPEVMCGPSVQQGLDAGTFTMATFFPDGTHPSDIGHALYANALSPVVIQSLDQPMPAFEKNLTTLVGTGRLEYARLDAISPIGSTNYWTNTGSWIGVPIWKTDSLSKPITFKAKGEGIQFIYIGKLSLSWKHNGVLNTQILNGASGLPAPNGWTFPSNLNPDGDTITVQAVDNGTVAPHAEIRGFFSIQRPATGDGRMAAPSTKSMAFLNNNDVNQFTLANPSNTNIQKVSATTVVNDSTGIASDLIFNNSGVTLAGYCGVVTDSFVSGTGIVSPGGSGIGILNLFANSSTATYSLSGTTTFNAIGKDLAGKDFDQINMSTINGTLDVSGASLSLSVSYNPVANDTITLMTSQSIVGKFNTVSLPQGWTLLYGINYVKAVYSNVSATTLVIGNESISVFGAKQAIVVNNCEGKELVILNSLGQLLKTITPISNNQVIPIQNGIYFVKTTYTTTKKVMVR